MVRRSPYHLIGWSMGGLVAYEMACQLEESGQADQVSVVPQQRVLQSRAALLAGGDAHVARPTNAR